MLNLFRNAPLQEELQDPERIKKEYKYWRFRIFYSTYIGYAFFYLTRKSFTFAMPAMMVDLGLSKTDIGILGSVLYITYGLSKFVSGVMSDRSNPRYFMAIGLMLTGLFNIFFGFSSSVALFALFWGLNGWFQGWGWPPCARLLTYWYSQSERGRWWAVWNTCHNVGGAVIPLIAAVLAERWGWRWAMYVPGLMCICIGFFLINRLRDTPRSLGLPSIEVYRKESTSAELQQERMEGEKEYTQKEILWEFVLKNWYIWVLAFAYFFVYAIRIAINDWGQLFLYEEKKMSLFSASACIFSFEIGGFLGNLVAGWLSDTLFKGKRGPINALFSLGSALAVISLWFTPFNSVVISSMSMFAVGFLIFGPQMLIGVAATELSHKKAAGTATGFTGWFAYFGAAAAGYPLGKIAQDYGWGSFFVVLTACALIAAASLFPLWKVKYKTVTPLPPATPAAPATPSATSSSESSPLGASSQEIPQAPPTSLEAN